MPKVELSIYGDGTEQFVLDWALDWGYQQQISEDNPDTGEIVMVDNPESEVEFIQRTIFENAKRVVRSRRLRIATEEIQTSIESDLESITSTPSQ